jgi:hypothetical protein
MSAPADTVHPRTAPQVWVVIVHHKGAGLLTDCLTSLLASEGVTLETVVVANDCREPLPAVCRERRVHVVESPRSLGFSAANNLGVARVRSELAARGVEQAPVAFFFVNNDTVTPPGTVAALLAELAAHPRCAVVGPRVMIHRAQGFLNSLGLNVTAIGEAWDEGIGIHLETYGPLPDRREVLAVTGSALLLRGSALAELGGWTELYEYYFEDIDLCLKAWAAGHTVRSVPEAVIEHALSATAGQMSDFKRLLSWRNQLVLVLLHWPPGLLLRWLPHLVAGQLAVFVARLKARAYADARLQARAWWGAAKLLPRIVRQRLHRGRGTGWVRFLAAPGTVPEIRLPQPTPPPAA